MRPPVNFVIPFSDKFIEELHGADPDLLARVGGEQAAVLSRSGALAWCFLTFRRLAQRGYQDLALSNRIDPLAINVIHSEQLAALGFVPHAFCVSARADHPRRPAAQFQIVQNRTQAGTKATWIHHWPQPGLIARKTPIERIRQVAYIGQTYNGNLALGEEDWRAQCAARGIDFHAPAAGEWHRLDKFDACIAIRSFDNRQHNSKPASKLLNAWHAGVPLIAGNDSAFTQIGTPGDDYLIANSMAEALDCLERLDRDVALRNRIIERGKARAAALSNDAIATLWIETIDGPIRSRFAEWQAHPAREAVRAIGLAAIDRIGSRIKRTIWNLGVAAGTIRPGE